jgi:putative membrane-bound dehydrogenase-like protein
MNRLLLVCVLLLAAASLMSGEPPAAVKTHEIQLNGHTFTLPLDFEIELAAGPPVIDRPITADFDDQGRLYVADSSGTNEKVQEQLQKKPHKIIRLEDTRGTGRFDHRAVFADQMMFPEGTMWHAGSLYVAAPPSIWKLTDTKGKGVADERVEWFQGKTLTGCANDLHGPYLGPDGWIYWCKGAFAKQTYERPGKPPFVTRASHIFRCRSDGSGLEPVMSGGMDNPVDVVFTPSGERIFTTTFFQHPGGGKRDGLIHAIYGGIYGKEHDPIYEHPWTSPAVMPVLTHMGAAAPCGLVRYESTAFGPDYQDNLFAAQFNLHKISRHVLVRDGATFKSRDKDFLVSNNFDFHPTDVLEDADGSLLVVDTGGWYKLCCPTSQLPKPDVLGAIYRVRRKGAPRLDDPRGQKLDWSKMTGGELANLLGDARPAVRRRAVQALATKDADAVPILTDVLRTAKSTEARRNAVWTATRIEPESARAVVRLALADSDETVRQTALHSVSLWRDRGALPTLVSLLKSPSLHNRRGAAEALGRIGDKSAVPALFEAVSQPADRALEHALTFALIEIADREGTKAGLHSGNVLIRRAALTALDQMTDGGLQVSTVAAEMASPDARLKETASWIAGRHPEWGGALAGFLRDRLATKNLTPTERDELGRQLARFAKAAPVQELLAEQLRDPAAGREARQIVLKAMALSTFKETPEAWIAALTKSLAGDDSELLRDVVAAARTIRVPKQRPAKLEVELLRIARLDKAPVDVRLNALAAVPGGLTRIEPALFVLVQSQLGSEQPVAIRSVATEVLSRSKLTSEQLLALTETLKTVGPMEADRLLEPFGQSTDEKVGLSLIAALKNASARSSLRVDAIKLRLAKYSPNVQKQAEELYALLNVDLAKQRARLEELMAHLQGGDIRRGQAVFKSTKAACSACHAIGYLGGNVGPDLTHIGKIRTERDLLESIVFPSASFVRSYEPVLVSTRDGKVYNGLIRKDSQDELVLATGVNQEVRLSRAEVEDIQPSKVSVMPAGLEQQLSPRDLADLVAFLKACQ